MNRVFLVLALALMLYIPCAEAQNFIGLPKKDCIEALKNKYSHKWKLVYNLENHLIAEHKELEGVNIAYTIQEDICTSYLLTHPIKDLSSVIEAYNQNYIRQSKNEWVNKDLTLKLTLFLREDRFNVHYEKL